MTITLACNPSRGTHWWELSDGRGGVLLLGPICDSPEEAEQSAESARQAIATTQRGS